ncbi:MAG: hypothetical protein NXI32_17025, partial [bacterium]|nr:hypothetical protein [bacterium]
TALFSRFSPVPSTSLLTSCLWNNSQMPACNVFFPSRTCVVQRDETRGGKQDSEAPNRKESEQWSCVETDAHEKPKTSLRIKGTLVEESLHRLSPR